MRILITNNTLGMRAGSELYVRDLASRLLQCGHTPIAYSTTLGEVARELREMTVPVIASLDMLTVPPDIIHGQHHVETMTALLHFRQVPAIFFCHGWLPWEEIPPHFPRILRYVAVDHTCRDRLTYEHAIPEECVRVIFNFVDLQRFNVRPPLPARPKRALVFSNNMCAATHLGAVQEACARAGIELDVIGASVGQPCAQPEQVLGRYDLVFAKARCALEALAVGTAVILCDTPGVGPMVTTGELEQLRQLNFGIRTLRDSLHPDVLTREIARYDAVDAAEVSRRIRASAGLEAAVDDIVALYREVLCEYTTSHVVDAEAEGRAAATYLRWLTVHLRQERQALLQERQALLQEVNKLTISRWREHILRIPLLGPLARLAVRKLIGPRSGCPTE